MTSKQRAYLRSLAQTMSPTFQIGKNGITPELTEAIADHLEANELIKISVLKNCFEEPKDLGILLSERTKSTLVHVMGRKIVLYKESKEHKKIELPKA